MRTNWPPHFFLLLIASGFSIFSALAWLAKPAAAAPVEPRFYSQFVPMVMRLPPGPALQLTDVPPYGSSANLQGRVFNAVPASYRVAVYIYVSGWWTKPTFAAPLTPIQPDGTWVADITTGGSDALATQIAAFLVPLGYTPPAMSGAALLPQELYQNALSSALIQRPAGRTLRFSGHLWEVKSAAAPVGPGPNYFSDAPADVWVDNNGYLHLTIVQRGGVWYSTEVICLDTLQYGAYTLTLGSRVDWLDKNTVLGFFTWDGSAPQYHYREIDIEFSRWGQDGAQNAQYVIQPWDAAGNRHRYWMNLPGSTSVHRIDWRADRIQFDSWDENQASLQSWTYTQTASIPPSGGGNLRLNFWLMNGWAPSNGQEAEVIIRSFRFTPANP